LYPGWHEARKRRLGCGISVVKEQFGGVVVAHGAALST